MSLTKKRKAELREYYKSHKDLRILRAVLLGFGLVVVFIPVMLFSWGRRLFEVLDDFMNDQVRDVMWSIMDTITDWYARLRKYPAPPDVQNSRLKKPCYPQDCDPDCPGEEELPGPPRMILFDDHRTETDEEYESRTGRKP